MKILFVILNLLYSSISFSSMNNLIPDDPYSWGAQQAIGMSMITLDEQYETEIKGKDWQLSEDIKSCKESIEQIKLLLVDEENRPYQAYGTKEYVEQTLLKLHTDLLASQEARRAQLVLTHNISQPTKEKVIQYAISQFPIIENWRREPMLS